LALSTIEFYLSER